jgi:prevent-host-death family protein
MQRWQLQDAKSRLSEVVDRAQRAPQGITRHGKPVAVVMSQATFERLSRTKGSLFEFMQASPLAGADDLEFERDTGLTRDVALPGVGA